MARPEKTGLDYFPFESDFFQEPTIRLLSARFGNKGLIMIIRLFCEIYRYKGYYLTWDEETALLFVSEFGNTFTVSFLTDVLNESLKRGIFDKNIFDQFAVLTSKGIQERYNKICRDAKRKHYEINPDYCLIDINSGNTPEETGLTPEETGLTREFSTQSKVNESKVEYKTFKSSSSHSRSSGAAGKNNLQSLDIDGGDNYFLNIPESENWHNKLPQAIDSLYRHYCNKEPHKQEIKEVIQILERQELSFQEAWECVLESFKEFTLVDSGRQNTRYLLKMLKGKIKDQLKKNRDEEAQQNRREAAARNREQAIMPNQLWDQNAPNPVRNWCKQNRINPS